jgi:hypothetical protein
MTDNCNDINDQLRKKEEELARIDKMLAKQRAINENLKIPIKGKRKRATVLTAIDGAELTVDMDEWKAKAEQMAIDMGDDKIQQMVSAGLESQQRPLGRMGRMINYADLAPTKENFAKVLELEAQSWQDTSKGKEFKRPFTQHAAGRAVLDLINKFGGDKGIDPRAAAQYYEKLLPGIHKLPVTAYSAARARWQTNLELADALEDAANAIETNVPISPQAIKQLQAIVGWGHYFEQLDNVIRRKMGQGLQSLQKDMENGIPLIDLDRDVTDMNWNDITGDSFAQQIIEHINNEDPLKLRRLAMSKRLLGLTETPLNESGFSTQLRLLNHYRRGNLFSSIATHVRNVASGTLVAFDFAAQDFVKGALKTDFKTALEAAGHTNRRFLSVWETGLNNSWEAFKTGRQRLGGRNLKEVAPEVLQESKNFVDGSINSAWDQLTNFENFPVSAPAQTLSMLTLVHSSWRKMLGKYISEQFFDSDFGYFPEYRGLGAEDEMLRALAGFEGIHMNAYIEAIDMARGIPLESRNLGERMRGGTQGGPRMGPRMDDESASMFAQRYADEAAEKAVFNIEKQFTDEDLKKLRFNELGVPMGENMDNDDMRLLLFNNLQGVPNTANRWGKALKERGDKTTFTQKFDNKGEGKYLGNAMLMARKNPYAVMFMPTFQTWANGTAYSLDRNGITQGVKMLVKEFQTANGRAPNREELADIRAGYIVSLGITTFVTALAMAGLMTSSAPTDPRERERWERAGNVPYSISSPNWGFLGGKPMEVVKTQVGSIDFFDTAFLGSDAWRAVLDGFITPDEYRGLMPELNKAFGQFIRQKNALRTFVDFHDAFMNADGNGQEWVRAFSSISNGYLAPSSGLFGNLDRTLESNRAGERTTRRRYMNSQEMQALEKNEIWNGLRPVRSFLAKAFANVPIVDDIFPAPRSKDWLGIETRSRFLGIPADRAIPFTQIVKSRDPLHVWLERHGMGAKPWPDGVITDSFRDESGKNFLQIQLRQTKTETSMGRMSEEDFFREAMHSTPGDLESIYNHLSPNQIQNIEDLVGISVERLFAEKTMTQALRMISKDPEFNLFLEGEAVQTADGELISARNITPSLAKNPGKTLGQRKSRDKLNMLGPVNSTIEYYKQVALYRLLTEVPSVRERVNAMYNQETRRGIIKLDSSPQGVGYQ